MIDLVDAQTKADLANLDTVVRAFYRLAVEQDDLYLIASGKSALRGLQTLQAYVAQHAHIQMHA